jgi:hypothetical protein
MINFSFNISWPWFKHMDPWQVDYIEKTWKISKHKSLEIQLSKAGNTLIGGSFDWHTRRDHAGVMLELNLLRHFFIINFYDNRHWNDEKGRYVNYDDPKEVEKHW